MEKNRERIQTVLSQQGFSKDAIKFSNVRKEIIYKTNEKGHGTDEIDRFDLSQEVTIASKDFVKLGTLTPVVEPLNMEGIEITLHSMSYYYPRDKLEKIKIELLSEATQNARKRAEQFANNGGSRVGALVRAQQGLFQVLSEDSTGSSHHDAYDTALY